MTPLVEGQGSLRGFRLRISASHVQPSPVARAVVTLLLTGLLGVALGLLPTARTAGAPTAPTTVAPISAESHSACPGDTIRATFERPAAGWRSGEWHSDGVFSALLYVAEEAGSTSVGFDDAYPLVVMAVVTDEGGSGPAEAFSEPVSYAQGLRGANDVYAESIEEIELCYQEPPPRSTCPDSTSYFSPAIPATGWPPPGDPDDDPQPWTTFGDGTFSVEIDFYGPREAEVDHAAFDFRGADPPVVTVFVWSKDDLAQYPGDDQQYQPPGTREDTSLSASWDRITRIEFCYRTPLAPPPATSCPADLTYVAIVEPDGGWYNGSYTVSGFSVTLDFFAPALSATGIPAVYFDFASASRPVRKVFVADASNLPVQPWPGTGLYPLPGVTAAETLHGPDIDWITRIELCYVPLVVLSLIHI